MEGNWVSILVPERESGQHVACVCLFGLNRILQASPFFVLNFPPTFGAAV